MSGLGQAMDASGQMQPSLLIRPAVARIQDQDRSTPLVPNKTKAPRPRLWRKVDVPRVFQWSPSVYLTSFDLAGVLRSGAADDFETCRIWRRDD